MRSSLFGWCTSEVVLETIGSWVRNQQIRQFILLPGVFLQVSLLLVIVPSLDWLYVANKPPESKGDTEALGGLEVIGSVNPFVPKAGEPCPRYAYTELAIPSTDSFLFVLVDTDADGGTGPLRSTSRISGISFRSKVWNQRRFFIAFTEDLCG